MNEVDTRVVQMQFDNGSFEKGVKTSLYTLEELKRGLELDKAVKSVQELQKTFNGFSIEPLSDAVSELTDRFTSFGIVGMEAIENITNRMVDFGISFAKNITFGNAIAGFQKYEAEMEAVQAIQSATGLGIDEIGKSLEKLQAYCDETSYSYSDMNRTMSHFVKTSLTLDQSEKAVEGIANACADAGIGIRQADRAFEVFSKAMQMGHLGRNQYDSLHLMNFTTNKFNELLIETAKEVGTIDAKTGKIAKTIDGTSKKAKGEVITLSNLEKNLHSGIITSEVLYKVLAKYQDQSTEFGAAAYAAAQNAKTFTDVVDSVKDAISTGWKDTYVNIFGDLDLARKRWTDIANYTIDLVGEVAEYRNKITEPFNELGIPGNLIRSYYYFGMTLKDLAHNAADAVKEVFPILGKDYSKTPTKGGQWGVYSPDDSISADDFYPESIPLRLAEIAKKIEKTFRDLNTFIKLNKESIQNILGGVIARFAIVGQAVSAVWKRIKLIGSKFKPLFSPVLKLFGQIGKTISNFSTYIRDNKIFHQFSEKFEIAFKPITDLIPKAVEWVTSLTDKFKEVNSVLDQNGGKLWMIDSPIARILEGLISLWDILTDIGAFVLNVFSQIVAAVAPYASDFVTWILDMAGSLGEWITKVNESGIITDTLQKWSAKLGDIIETLKSWGNTAWEWVSSTGIIEAIKNKFNSFNRWLTKMVYGRTEAQQLAADQLEELNKKTNNGNVNLVKRPTVTLEYMRKRGWDVGEGDGIATLFSSSYTEKFGDKTITFGITPIMPDGRVLTPRGLNNYIDKLIDMGDWDKALKFDRSKEGKGILLPWVEVPKGEDPKKYEAQLSEYLDTVHELHGELYSIAEEDDSLEVMGEFAEKTNKQASGIALIQSALDKLHTSLTNIAKWFNEHSISQMLSEFFGGLSTGFNAFFGKIGAFFTADTSSDQGLSAKLSTRIGAMKDFAEDGSELPTVLNAVLTCIQNIIESIGSFGSSLSNDITKGVGPLDYFGGIIAKIAHWLGEIFASFMGGFTKDLGPLELIKWKRGIEFANSIAQFIMYAKDTFELPATIAGVFEDINTSITGGEGYYTVRLKRIAESIFAIGLGVAAIAWAVGHLANISWTGAAFDENGNLKFDTSGLVGGIGALTVILFELEKFLEAVGKNTQLESGRKGLSTLFGSGLYSGALDLALKLGTVALVVSSLAKSVKLLSEIQFIDTPKADGKNEGSLVSGLTGLTIILGELFAFIETTKELNVLGGATGFLNGFTVSGKLKAIAKTVKSLAESVKLLSEINFYAGELVTNKDGSIDWTKTAASTLSGGSLISGLTGLFVILGELAAFIKMTGTDTLLGNTKWGTFKLKAIADSVNSLALTVKMLSDIPPLSADLQDAEGNINWAKRITSGGLISGLGGLFVLLEELALFMAQNGKGMNLLGDTKWGTFKLKAIADSVRSLALTVKLLSDIPPIATDLQDAEGNINWAKRITSGGLISGLGGLFVLLEELALFMAQNGKGMNLLGETKWGTFKLMGIAKAVDMLANTVKMLSEIPPMDLALDENGVFDIKNAAKTGSLVTGLGALFVLLEGLVAIQAQFNTLDKVGGQGLGKTFLGLFKRLDLMEIATAVSMMVDATVKLANLGSVEGAIAAIGTVGEGGALFLLQKLLSGVGELSVSGAFANLLDSGKFIIIAKGMNMLADGITKLGTLKWEELGSGLGTMVASMVAAGGGAEFFKNISLSDIGTMLVDIGAFVGGSIALFTGIQALIDFMEELVNDMDPVEGRIWTVTDQLNKFSEVMTGLGKVVGSFFGGIVGGFLGAKEEAQNAKQFNTEELIAALHNMGDTAKAIPFDELETLETHIQKIKELGGSLVLDNGDHILIDAATPIYDLAQNLTDLSGALEQLGTVLNGTVDASYLTKLREVSNIMQGLVSIGSNIYTETGGDTQKIDTWVEGVKRFFNDIGSNTYVIGEVAGNLAAQFTISFNQHMSEKGGESYIAGQGIATQAKNGARSVYTDFFTTGAYLVDGLIEGVYSKADKLSTAISTLMSASAVAPANKTVEVGSPSKVFARIGAFMAEGLVVGLQSRTKVVEDASAAMALAAIDATDSATSFEDIFGDINGNPVIRPVLDLGDIRSGASVINGMLDDTSISTRDMDFSRIFEMPSVTVEGNSNMLAAINSVNERLDNLGNAVTNMAIVLDTGVMVGSLTTSIDQQLGKRTIMRERGV